MVKRLTLLIFSLLLISTSRGAVAQGGSAIAYGQTVTGKITNDNSRVIFTFQGHKGDVIDVALNRTDGTLDPVLILADAQNNLIAMNDESDADASAAIVSQQLPADGAYFLIVTRFGQGLGYTTGSFSLTLSHAGVAAGSSQTLSYGDSVVGEISGTQYQQVYTFHATRGDIISVRMQRISGDLDSYLILADSTGAILTVQDDDPNSPGTLDAAITNLRIERTGNYVLVATRFGREAGGSHGGYSLSLDHLPPESLGAVPEKAILIDYGVNVTGSVDNSHVMTFYLIEARKGDVLTIIAQRIRGNLDPTLVLYTSDLKELAQNDSGIRGQEARISAFVVPADNTYILMVSRFNRDKGITAGGYSLSVIGRPGARVGAGGKLTLQYGGAVSAIISDSSAQQQYTFTATSGDIITVSMDATSGNLLPALVLLDPAGKQVVLDDPGTGSARLSKVKLGAGNYVIVATRRGRDKGMTQGTYALILTLENPR